MEQLKTLGSVKECKRRYFILPESEQTFSVLKVNLVSQDL